MSATTPRTQYAITMRLQYPHDSGWIAKVSAAIGRSHGVPLVSLVIYLCSATADYRATDGSGRQPSSPPPKRTKGRERHFPAARPTVWETAYRIGAALRGAWRDVGEAAGGAHASPRPHIRRAHWHGFWLDPKTRPGERRMDVRWMPPLPVGVARLEDLVPVIRPVK